MSFSLAAVRPWWYIAPLALVVLLAAAAAGSAAPGELGTEGTVTDVRVGGSYFDRSVAPRTAVAPNVTIVEPSAFDWGDAGVGAAGAFGLVLLAGGVVLVSHHNRRRAV